MNIREQIEGLPQKVIEAWVELPPISDVLEKIGDDSEGYRGWCDLLETVVSDMDRGFIRGTGSPSQHESAEYQLGWWAAAAFAKAAMSSRVMDLCDQKSGEVSS